MNKIKRFAAALLALSMCFGMASCSDKKNENDNSSVVEGVPVSSSPAQNSSGESSGDSSAAEDDTSSAEAKQLHTAINKLYTMDGFHAKIRADVSLDMQVGDETNQIPIRADIVADVTPSLIHATYTGSDLDGDTDNIVGYEVWSDYPAAKTYTTYGSTNGEKVWRYQNLVVWGPGYLEWKRDNFTNAQADGNVYTVPLSDLKNQFDWYAYHSADNSSGGTVNPNGLDNASIFDVVDPGDPAYGTSSEGTTEPVTETTTTAPADKPENLSDAFPTDLREYLQNNFDKLSGVEKFTVEKGKVTKVEISDASVVLADTTVEGKPAKLTLTFSMKMDISDMTADELSEFKIPDDARNAREEYIRPYTASFTNIISSNAGSFKLDDTEFKVLEYTSGGLKYPGWTEDLKQGSLTSFTSDKYSGTVVSIVDDGFGQVKSITATVEQTYRDALAKSTWKGWKIDETDKSLIPALTLNLNGQDISWGMTAEEIVALLGEPVTITESESAKKRSLSYAVSDNEHTYIVVFDVISTDGAGMVGYTVTVNI